MGVPPTHGGAAAAAAAASSVFSLPSPRWPPPRRRERVRRRRRRRSKNISLLLVFLTTLPPKKKRRRRQSHFFFSLGHLLLGGRMMRGQGKKQIHQLNGERPIMLQIQRYGNYNGKKTRFICWIVNQSRSKRRDTNCPLLLQEKKGNRYHLRMKPILSLPKSGEKIRIFV